MDRRVFLFSRGDTLKNSLLGVDCIIDESDSRLVCSMELNYNRSRIVYGEIHLMCQTVRGALHDRYCYKELIIRRV